MSKPKVKETLSCALWIVGVLVVAVWVTKYFLQSPGSVEFRLHRAQYERIIGAAKAMNITPGGNSHFWVTKDLVPVAPGRIVKHNDMTGMVDVFRDVSGAYRISIITNDEGYSGTFGYLYADGELTFPENTTGLTSVQRPLGPHWWTGYNGKW